MTLSSQIKQAVESYGKAVPEDGPRIIRLKVPMDSLDPLPWLDAQKFGPKIYWSDREGRFESAAIGISDSVHEQDNPTDYSTLLERLSKSLFRSKPEVRYYGGSRFNLHGTSDPIWQDFGFHRYILPRFELNNQNGESFLVCNLIFKNDSSFPLSDILADLDRIASPPSNWKGHIPPLIGRHDIPDKIGWQRNVESALQSIHRGGFKKIVLARRSSLEFKKPLNPLVLLQRLKSVSPHCFHFCFSPAPGVAFIGASPERLYTRQGKLIRSEAIAGTRPRGDSVATDEVLGQDLLRSDKDFREHQLVVQGIREALAPLCESLEVGDNLSLLRLSQCQHLASVFEGTLLNGVRDGEVIQHLHPTPAVGGYPTAPTLGEIDRLESFDRGWYAGPIGWLGPDAADFAVAIRSGLVEGARLCLFSGAGIVAGSTPEAEWDEIENKIDHFIQALAHA